MIKRTRIAFLAVFAALVLGTVGGVLAQAEDGLTRTDQPGFTAFTCRYNEEAGRSEIIASLAGPGGAVVAAADITAVSVARTGGEPLSAESVSVAPAETRQPARVVLVLDTTDTMPLDQIKGLLLDPSRGFMPDLQGEDEIALVAVDESVTGPTPFSNDKNALYNDRVADLATRAGTNVIYEGIQAAVGATTPNSPARQAILVITDSGYIEGRADEAVALVNEIITVAQASNAQIYPISFSSLNAANVPDPDLLNRLANETGGVGWTYAGDKSPARIVEAIGTALEEFYAVLNGEVVISADLTGLEADETGFVPLDVSLTLASGATLTDTIACAPPPAAGQEVVTPAYTIAFRNLVEGLQVSEALVAQVAAAPEPLPDGALYRFFLDDEPNDSADPEFTIAPADINPGVHTLRAQLRDDAGNTLATTPTVSFYTQRPLVLTTGAGGTVNLSGPLTLQAANLSPNIGAVEFTLVDANDPAKTLSLGTAAATNGTAMLEVPNIQDAANTLLPGQTDGWNVQVVAIAAGASADSPPLGVSNTLNLSVQPKPQDVVSQVFADPATAGQVVNIGAPILLTLLFIVVDFILWRQLKKARIKKLINRPDGHDLSANLMQLTVSRAGQRQTFVLTKKTMVVGRGSGNDISLDDDANVSRQHGVVMWRGQKWYYANRKPKVKSRVNGKTIKGLAMVRLDNPTEINIGDYQIVFHGGDTQRDISDLVKTNL
jgi:hypothetical protein